MTKIDETTLTLEEYYACLASLEISLNLKNPTVHGVKANIAALSVRAGEVQRHLVRIIKKHGNLWSLVSTLEEEYRIAWNETLVGGEVGDASSGLTRDERRMVAQSKHSEKRKEIEAAKEEHRQWATLKECYELQAKDLKERASELRLLWKVMEAERTVRPPSVSDHMQASQTHEIPDMDYGGEGGEEPEGSLPEEPAPEAVGSSEDTEKAHEEVVVEGEAGTPEGVTKQDEEVPSGVSVVEEGSETGGTEVKMAAEEVSDEFGLGLETLNATNTVEDEKGGETREESSDNGGGSAADKGASITEESEAVDVDTILNDL